MSTPQQGNAGAVLGARRQADIARARELAAPPAAGTEPADGWAFLAGQLSVAVEILADMAEGLAGELAAEIARSAR